MHPRSDQLERRTEQVRLSHRAMSRKEKLLLTCNLPLPCTLRARVWSFVSSSSSWWPTIVLPDDLGDCSIEARDGDRVLISGRQHVDTHLLKVGVVACEELNISPEAVYVCRKRMTHFADRLALNSRSLRM